MINDPRYRDPLYPRSPGVGDNAARPDTERPEIQSGSGRASAAIALMLIALFVVGLVVFSGGDNVDPTQTASPGIEGQQEELLPPTEQPLPENAAPAEEAPAAAPPPAEPAPSE